MTASAKVFEFDRERILSARRERLSRVYLDNLAGLPVWLGWRFEERNGKRTKVPYVGDAGKEPIKGSSTKPATWRTRAECDRWAAQHHGGIGIVLGTDIGDGRRLVGIDLDACIAENGELADWAAETIKRIGSYAETSPSGAGVKIFALVGADDTPPIALALQTVGKGNQGGAWKASATDGGKAPGVEIYTGGRFFTVTDDRLDDAPGDLRPVSLDTVRWLIGFASERFGATGKGKGSGSDKKSKSGRTDYSRSADALKVAGQGYRAGKFTDQAGMKAYLLGCDDPSVVGWTATKGSERRSGTDDYELGNIWQTISTVPAEILELNDTYALILTGGKTAVLKEAGADWELIGVDAFKQWHGNASVIDGRNSKPLGGYWLTHPRRRSYDGLVFAPEGAPPTKFNLWKGWATDPKPGECRLFLDHLRDNVCRGDTALFNWVIGWFAAIFQQPTEKFGTSLVLRGKQGVGKTKIGEVIGSLLGTHYALVDDPRYVTGRFNAHLAPLLLLFADEAFWAGDKTAEGRLKSLITGKAHFIEFKGKEVIRVRNLVRLLVSGNPDWLVPAGMDERRFAVLDVGADHIQDHVYFAAIDRQMDNGGREALLHHLLTFDLSKVNLRTIPKNEALLEQKIASLSGVDAWILDFLRAGRLPWCEDCADSEAPRELMFASYIEHAKTQGIARRATETAIGGKLHKTFPDMRDSRPNIEGKRTYTYRFPPLAECRRQFEALFGQEIDWGGKRAGFHPEDEWVREPESAPLSKRERIVN